MRRLEALLVTVALCTSPACQKPATPAPEEVKATDLRSRLTFAPSAPASAAALVTLPAEVTLPPGASLVLGPPMAGRLLRWEVSPGQSINAGQVLASLQSLALSDLKAEEMEASRVVRERKRLLEARQEGAQAGFRDMSTVEEAKAGLGEAQAHHASLARRVRSRGQKSTVDGRWEWYAPQAGVVASVTCSAGSVTTPEASCLTLMDTQQAEIQVRIPEGYLAKLGTSARGRWTGRGKDQQVEVELTRRDAALRTSDRTLASYFKPSQGQTLWVGSTGRITVLTEAMSGLASVPSTALTSLQGKDVIFVPTEDPKRPARPLEVRVRGRLEGDVLIEAEGFTPGDQVVTRGAFLLKSIHLLAKE